MTVSVLLGAQLWGQQLAFEPSQVTEILTFLDIYGQSEVGGGVSAKVASGRPSLHLFDGQRLPQVFL